jgi:NAD+ kinase
VLYTSWLFQRVVPPVASFSLGSLGFLTPFDFSDFRHTLRESFDKGVTARLRMRFECTIMKVIKNGDPTSDESENLESLEMHPRNKSKTKHSSPPISNHHTEEYWKSHSRDKPNEWMEEEESLNKGHRPSVSFSVLNELVVVYLRRCNV